MDLIRYFRNIIFNLKNLEGKISKTQKYSPRDLSEILQNAKKENICYLEKLSKINRLSAFDTSFLLSSVKLDERKVEIIKQAAEMYREEEFKNQGQTFSDFMFKVAANIDMLDLENLELFKELAKCKNEIYDFAKVLKNPAKYMEHRHSEMKFAFQKVFY